MYKKPDYEFSHPQLKHVADFVILTKGLRVEGRESEENISKAKCSY